MYVCVSYKASLQCGDFLFPLWSHDCRHGVWSPAFLASLFLSLFLSLLALECCDTLSFSHTLTSSRPNTHTHTGCVLAVERALHLETLVSLWSHRDITQLGGTVRVCVYGMCCWMQHDKSCCWWRVWRAASLHSGVVMCTEEGGAGCQFSMQSRCVCRGTDLRGGTGRTVAAVE